MVLTTSDLQCANYLKEDIFIMGRPLMVGLPQRVNGMGSP